MKFFGNSQFFVTGTGTDIGKTFVTASIIHHLRAEGICARGLKPIASGYDPTRPAESDAGVLLEAMGEPATAEAVARLSPWRFAAPLSPDMAAARESRTIELDAVVNFCRREEMENRDAPLFIEGVGGVMVPLDGRHTVLDWMAALDLPVVLVAGSYLGTLSHTLTAAEACARRGLKLAALVVNESEQSPVPIQETAATLRRFLPGAPIATLARGRPSQGVAALAELLFC
jgi:dethiobiotin synthetase